MSEFMQLILRYYVCAVRSCNPGGRGKRFFADLLRLVGEENEFAIWFRAASTDLREAYCHYHIRNGKRCFVPGIVKAAECFFLDGEHDIFKANELIRILKTSLPVSEEDSRYTNLSPLATHIVGKEKKKRVITWWWDELEEIYLPFGKMMKEEIRLRRKLETDEPTGRFTAAIERIARCIYVEEEAKGPTVSMLDALSPETAAVLVRKGSGV